MLFINLPKQYSNYRKEDGSIEEIKHRGVAETFFRLFEEYPQSRAFFGHLGSISLQSLSVRLFLFVH